MSETENNINHPKETPVSSRRSLLTKLWVLLGIIALAEMIAIVVAFFKPGPKKIGAADSGAIVVAGPAENYQPGTVTAFVRGKFYLARLEDGGFLALSRTCTHLGCTVPWDEDAGQFACPCHASVFDMTGSVVKSPAPRPLDCFPVAIENNVIRVDIGRRIRRNQFRDDQVTYAKSDAT